MSAFYNLKSSYRPNPNYELRGLQRPWTRELIRLNRSIDPKFGYEQTIVAREIAADRYVDGDGLVYDELPERLYLRMPARFTHALLTEGRIQLASFGLNPRINGSDLPDTPDSPYILALREHDGRPGLPVALGRRALVFRVSLDAYANLRRYNSCLAIDNPDEFVSCVTGKLDEVLSKAGIRIVRVLHAPCVYQWSRLIGTQSVRGSHDAADSNAEDAKYFIKPGYGFHDAEFRLVWILDQDFEGHVDIQCPDLPRCCALFTEDPF